MTNYQRFNNFISDYESKLDEENNSTNDEILQKSLAENANEYVRRSELGSGLLSGAQATYQGREYIQKAKGTYDTLKKLPKTLEEKVNKFKGEAKRFKGDVEEGVKNAKQLASDAKDAVEGLPQTVSEAKDSLESTVQAAKETVQGKIQDVKDMLNTGVQDAQDATQDGIVTARGGIQDGVARVEDATQDGIARAQDATQDGVARAESRYDGVKAEAPDALSGDPEDPLFGLSQDYFSSENIEPVEPQEQEIKPPPPEPVEMQEIKPRTLEEPQQKLSYNEIYDGDIQPQEPKPSETPGGETAKINQEISTAGKETEKGAQEAGKVAGEIGKVGEGAAATGEEVGGLVAGEEALGEGTAAVEGATGGVFSEVVLPVAAASMVGFAIYDLFKNKPKETKIAPKNLLVVPPKFTQEKESLATTSSLPQ